MNTDDLDPRLQAELAAARFEHAEKDRFMRARSFAYRHFEAFCIAGLAMILVFIVGILTIPNYTTATSTTGSTLLWVFMAIGWAGIFTILFSYARPDSSSAWNAWLKVIFVLTVVVILYAVVAVPMQNLMGV